MILYYGVCLSIETKEVLRLIIKFYAGGNMGKYNVLTIPDLNLIQFIATDKQRITLHDVSDMLEHKIKNYL